MEKINVRNSKEIAASLVDEKNQLLFDMSCSDTNKTVVSKVSLQYTQDIDGCSPIDCPNTIEISTEPDGYYVLKSERWAFDDPEELYALAKDFCSRFKNTAWATENDYNHIDKVKQNKQKDEDA